MRPSSPNLCLKKRKEKCVFSAFERANTLSNPLFEKVSRAILVNDPNGREEGCGEVQQLIMVSGNRFAKIVWPRCRGCGEPCLVCHTEGPRPLHTNVLYIVVLTGACVHVVLNVMYNTKNKIRHYYNSGIIVLFTWKEETAFDTVYGKLTYFDFTGEI